MAKELKSVLPPGDPFAAMNARGSTATAEPTKTTEVQVECLDPHEIDPSKLKGFLDAPTTPPAPPRYKADADPDLISSLELFERVIMGRLLLPHAYLVQDAILAQIATLKPRVETGK